MSLSNLGEVGAVTLDDVPVPAVIVGATDEGAPIRAANAAFAALVGRRPDELPGVRIGALVADAAGLLRHLDEAGPDAIDVRIRSGSRTIPAQCRGSAARLLVFAVDPPERGAEDFARQRWILENLRHRVRNTLSVIRSIVRRSAESYASPESRDLAMHIEGRIGAFSRVQAMAIADPGAGLDLELVLREELARHAIRDDGLVVEGPGVALRPRAAEVLGLAFHELVVNAIKYGAARHEGARLGVTWELRDGDLVVRWTETGVPPAPRGPSGFGVDYLERGLPHELSGSAVADWTGTGVTWTIRAPLAAVLGDAPEPGDP